MPRRRMRDMVRRSRDMRDRRMRDRRSERRLDRRRGDYRYDMGYYGGDYGSEYSRGYDSTSYPESDYARMGRRMESGREYDRHYEYPYMNDYNYNYRGRRDYRYDYGETEMLSNEELMEWSKDLMEDIEPQFKPHFERNRVLQRAKEMGVKFKDYSEDEYYVTALMMATDYGKTVGMNNTDQMFRMAVNWLEDEDSELQGGEKLAVYYDEIICPED